MKFVERILLWAVARRSMSLQEHKCLNTAVYKCSHLPPINADHLPTRDLTTPPRVVSQHVNRWSIKLLERLRQLGHWLAPRGLRWFLTFKNFLMSSATHELWNFKVAYRDTHLLTFTLADIQQHSELLGCGIAISCRTYFAVSVTVKRASQS